MKANHWPNQPGEAELHRDAIVCIVPSVSVTIDNSAGVVWLEGTPSAVTAALAVIRARVAMKSGLMP